MSSFLTVAFIQHSIVEYNFPSFSLFLDGQSEVEVRLVVRKYVDKGSSVTLHCEHNVPSKILYKVSVFCYC